MEKNLPKFLRKRVLKIMNKHKRLISIIVSLFVTYFIFSMAKVSHNSYNTLEIFWKIMFCNIFPMIISIGFLDFIYWSLSPDGNFLTHLKLKHPILISCFIASVGSSILIGIWSFLN